MSTSKKILSFVFFIASLCLFLMLISYNGKNPENNFFGLIGHEFAHILIEKIWGLSSFVLPIIGVLLAVAIQNKTPIESFFYRIVFLFLSAFFLNILLLNTFLINTLYVGAFAIIFHAFILHFVGTSSGATIGSLTIESLLFAFALGGFYHALPKKYQKVMFIFHYFPLKKIKNLTVIIVKHSIRLAKKIFTLPIVLPRMALKKMIASLKINKQNQFTNALASSSTPKQEKSSSIKNKKSLFNFLNINKIYKASRDNEGAYNNLEKLSNRSFNRHFISPDISSQIGKINNRAKAFPFITKIDRKNMSINKNAMELTSPSLTSALLNKDRADDKLNDSQMKSRSNGDMDSIYTIDLSGANFSSRSQADLNGLKTNKVHSDYQSDDVVNNHNLIEKEKVQQINEEDFSQSEANQIDVDSADLTYPIVLNITDPANFNSLSKEELLYYQNLNHYYESIQHFHGQKSEAGSDEMQHELQQTAHKLEESIREFGIEVKVVGFLRGPSITRFELTVEPGVKISRIANLADNIALTLAATSIRIVAPIPGKSAIGIEIPNSEREMVAFPKLTLTDAFQASDKILPIALGKSIFGTPIVTDLESTPHLLIAGATGSGKSVCVNTIIASLMLKLSPSEVRFLMIDPKMVELNIYNGTPHLLSPTITNAKQAAKSLKWMLSEMEARYLFLEHHGVRNIKTYNQMIKKRRQQDAQGHSSIASTQSCYSTLPYIVIVIDEFADLMMIARKEMEDSISRLAAMSRAVGIHLILATQRPSVDVITGVIKANFPARIAFQVPSKIDSRTILDESGAEKLIGKGDMLFQSAGASNPERIQGAFLSDDDIHFITSTLKQNQSPNYYQEIHLQITDDSQTPGSGNEEEDDKLFSVALAIVQNDQKASASYLQRKLKIGYNRAARLIETMEDKGLIGPANGMKSREILI